MNSCLAFYNFGSVGENASDHLVASKVMKGEVVPSVHYMDNSRCYAVGTGGILLYEGTQIPEEVRSIPVEQQISSVFYSDEFLGIVLEGDEKAHRLQVYDRKGIYSLGWSFDLDYTTLNFRERIS